MKRADVKAGDNVVIFGSGPIGLLMSQAALAQGATIVCVTGTEYQLPLSAANVFVHVYKCYSLKYEVKKILSRISVYIYAPTHSRVPHTFMARLISEKDFFLDRKILFTIL